MTKLKVFIDFEAISAPFNRDIELKRDFPYAYSIGVYGGKKLKTKTFIFNFNKDNPNDIYDILRYNMLKNVRILTGNKEFNINKMNVEFICYGLGLEKKILSNVYRGVKITDLSKGAMISLSKATEKYIEDGEYFTYFKKWVDKNIDKKFVEKRGLNHDGALAALAGYLLYADVLQRDGKFYHSTIDMRVLVKEIVRYSADDVIRMKYISENYKEFRELAASRKSSILKRNKLSRDSKRIEGVRSFLKSQNQEMTVELLVKELEKEQNEIDKKIDDLKI